MKNIFRLSYSDFANGQLGLECYCDRLKFSRWIGTFFLRNVPSGNEQEKTTVLAGCLKLFEPRTCFQFSKINEYSYFTHACTKPTKFQPTRFCKTTLHLKLLLLWEWTTCGHWDFRTCACLVKACFKISYVVVLVFGAIAPPLQTDATSLGVTCCDRLHTHILLHVVAQKLKPVKLLSQQPLTFLLFRDRRSAA